MDKMVSTIHWWELVFYLKSFMEDIENLSPLGFGNLTKFPRGLYFQNPLYMIQGRDPSPIDVSSSTI